MPRPYEIVLAAISGLCGIGSWALARYPSVPSLYKALFFDVCGPSGKLSRNFIEWGLFGSVSDVWLLDQ